ncbi:MAG: cysteine desulfurase family protein [Candidatus Paceibacterota bacterium]
MNDRIYLDYASTTPVDSRVLSAMEPYWNEDFFHPRSLHSDGKSVEEVIDEARHVIGHALGMQGYVGEVDFVFTSSGTESNTLALRGLLDSFSDEECAGKRVILSAIEHPSVADIKKYAEKRGMEVVLIPIDAEGIIDISAFKDALNDETLLVSVQLVNSEIGTIQPVREVVKETRKMDGRIYVHTDASQAWLWQSIDVEKLGVDLLTVDAHKMYGPKGIGGLFIKKDVSIEPLFLGSEKSYRSGTPPIPLIIGFREAVEIAEAERGEYSASISRLRDVLIQNIQTQFPQATINGSLEKRVPGNVSISFPSTNHEFLQMRLDEAGISVATRSACLESGGEGSFVISELPGGSQREALRVTLGKETTEGEVERFCEVLKKLF